MAEELPILKGILKGNFSYHNARKCKTWSLPICFFFFFCVKWLTRRQIQNAFWRLFVRCSLWYHGHPPSMPCHANFRNDKSKIQMIMMHMSGVYDERIHIVFSQYVSHLEFNVIFQSRAFIYAVTLFFHIFFPHSHSLININNVREDKVKCLIS